MAVSDALEALKQGITDAYTSVDEKGGTIPEKKNVDNLAGAIDSIEGGGGEVIQMRVQDNKFEYNLSRMTTTSQGSGILHLGINGAINQIFLNGSSSDSDYTVTFQINGEDSYPLTSPSVKYVPTQIVIKPIFSGTGEQSVTWKYSQLSNGKEAIETPVDVSDPNNWQDVSEYCYTNVRTNFTSDVDVPGKIYMLKAEYEARGDSAIGFSQNPAAIVFGNETLPGSISTYTNALQTQLYSPYMAPLSGTTGSLFATVTTGTNEYRYARAPYIRVTDGYIRETSRYTSDGSAASATDYRYGFFFNAFDQNYKAIGDTVNGLLKNSESGLDLSKHLLVWVNDNCESKGGLTYLLDTFKNVAKNAQYLMSTQFTGGYFVGLYPEYVDSSSQQAQALLSAIKADRQVVAGDTTTVDIQTPTGVTVSQYAWYNLYTLEVPESDFSNVKVVTIRYRDESTYETVSETVIIKGLPGSYIPDVIDLTNQYM